MPNNSELVYSRANRSIQDISLNPKRTIGWNEKEDVTHGMVERTASAV
jgi:hypothetical protein